MSVELAIVAWLGKDGIQKVLGPTADYLGDELKAFAQKRVDNIKSILSNASTKIPEHKANHGAVPPKVLKTIINEGSYSTDDLMVDYFGGILASSKSDLDRDDRGARIAQKMASLSSYQLRAHFILYSCLNDLFKGSGLSLDSDREKFQMWIPLEQFQRSMELSSAESDKFYELMQHTFHGLSQDGYIGDHWKYGELEYMRPEYPEAQTGGVVFIPTLAGIELFLWGFGFGDRSSDYIFDVGFNPKIEGVTVSKDGCHKI